MGRCRLLGWRLIEGLHPHLLLSVHLFRSLLVLLWNDGLAPPFRSTSDLHRGEHGCHNCELQKTCHGTESSLPEPGRTQPRAPAGMWLSASAPVANSLAKT